MTPVERVGIKVDDAPFLAVEMRVEDEADEPRLAFRTNVEDFVTVDSEHPLRFERGASEGLKPYVRVRGDLWALVKRALFYDLVALGGRSGWRTKTGSACARADFSSPCARRAKSRDFDRSASPPISAPKLCARCAAELMPSLGVRTSSGPRRARERQRARAQRREPAIVADARPAAVLAPIVERPDGLSVLLTLRASHLRAHSGQIAFPGGKIDPGETPREAALARGEEEIGLEARFIEPLGWLDPYLTGTGFRVAPLVALVEPSFTLTINDARSTRFSRRRSRF